MEKTKEVWALQLIQYFTQEHDYYRVTVVNRAANPSNDNPEDYWLISQDDYYDIIHIHAFSDDRRKAAYGAVRASCIKIRQVTKSTKPGKLLDISLDPLATDYSTDEADYVALHPGKTNQQLESVFPGIGSVIKDGSHSERTAKKLNRNIKKQSNKKVRKLNNKVVGKAIKEATSKTFIVTGIICVVLWAAINIVTVVLDTDTTSAAIAFGAYYKAFVTILNEYWRLLTSGFVHISFIHLLCNLMALYRISQPVEKQLGFPKTMVILLVSIIGGALCVHVSSGNTVVVGLSGGIYGLFAAYTIICIQKGYFKNRLFLREFLLNLYLNILISLMPNVSWVAHLGGLVAGGLVTVIVGKGFDKALKISCSVCLLATCLFSGYIYSTNSNFQDYYYGTDLEVASIWEKIGLTNYAYKITTETYSYYIEGE